jgi:hypothetical protein
MSHATAPPAPVAARVAAVVITLIVVPLTIAFLLALRSEPTVCLIASVVPLPEPSVLPTAEPLRGTFQPCAGPEDRARTAFVWSGILVALGAVTVLMSALRPYRGQRRVSTLLVIAVVLCALVGIYLTLFTGGFGIPLRMFTTEFS